MKKNFIVGIFLLGYIINTFSDYNWEQTSGPASAQILSIAVKGDTLFAGLYDGGIFRSCDKGESWHQSDSGLEERETVTSFLVSGGNIFAATKRGVYISTDNGNLWNFTTSKLSARNFTSLVTSGNRLIAGTESNGIYISSDNGKNWVSGNSGMNDSSILCLAANGTNLFAGTRHSVYYSTNSGSSWKKIYEHEGMCFKAITEYDGVLLVGANPIANEGSVGILYSSGKFDKWTASEPGLKYKGVKQLIRVGNTIYAATWGDGVFSSDDTGKTWKSLGSTGLTCKYLNSIAILDNTLFVATEGGIFNSSNKGELWTMSSSGIARTYVLDLENMGETIYAATEKDGVFYTKDNGKSWTQIVSGLKRRCVLSLTVNDNYVFCGTDSAGIFRNPAYGEWGQIGTGIVRNVPILYLSACGLTVFAKNISEIYRTNNNGDQWSIINNNFPRGMGTAFITNKNTIFCGGDSGIYRSDDNGTSWKPSNNGISNVKIISLANIGDTIFAGAYLKGVFRSTDNGTTWKLITPQWAFSVEKIVTVRKTVIALTSTSIIISNDGGNKWEKIDSTLNTNQFISMSVNSEYLFVGTRDDGVWRLPLKEVLSTVNLKKENLALLYPEVINSFSSDVVKIKFQLLKPGEVAIECFSPNGRKVFFIKNILPVGNYFYNIDKKNMSPGTYYIQIRIDGAVYSNNLIVLR